MVGRLKKLLPERSFRRSVAVLAGGTAAAQALVVLSSPVLTRLYDPDDFGTLAVYLAILVLAQPLATLSFEIAIPLPSDKQMAANLLGLGLITVAAASLVAGVVTWGWSEEIAELASTPEIADFLWLLPIGLAAAGTFVLVTHWGIRESLFMKIAHAKVAQAVGTVVTQLGIGIAHGGTAGLLVGDIVGRSGGSTVLFLPAFRHAAASLRGITLRGMRAAAMRYRRFPLFQSWGLLLNTLGAQLPVVLFVAFFGLEEGGWFGLASRVLQVPLTLIGTSVAQVYLGEAAELVRTNPDALIRRFDGTARKLLALAVVPSVVLMAAGGPLFELVFGERWFTAGVYGQMMAPMLLALFVVNPLSMTLNVIERQHWQAAWDTFRLGLVVGSMVLVGKLGFSPTITVAVFSATSTIAFVVLFVAARVGLSRYRDGALAAGVPAAGGSHGGRRRD